LARRLDVSLSTLHGEVQRLTQAKLLAERTLGRNRLVRANADHPGASALTRLLELSFGPRWAVAEAFAEVQGVDRLIIFGSWAARYLGEAGGAPHDVDVLIVGHEINRDAVYTAADRAETRLGWPVNPVFRTSQQWEEGTDPLVAQIQASPHLVVTPEE